MGAQQNTSGQMLSAINVTPFVDIVLVLLVVLMVSSIQIVKASIVVDLPKAASAGAAVESTINIVVTKEGELLLDGNPTNKDMLAAYVKQEAAKNPKIQAVISADKKVVYEYVVEVIDIIKGNGVVSFALNIERSSKEK